MPSETAAASPAVSSVHCAAPTWPGLWHDAQFASRAGITTRANDGLSWERGADGGAAISVGIANLDGSSAVSVIVNVTSSDVLTRPTIEMGPMPHVDIFTCVVAVSVSLPAATVPSTSHVTGAGLCFTVSSLSAVKWYEEPSVIEAGIPCSAVIDSCASGKSCESR